MVKSIIKRIIVGVGIALTLMFIKGNLFMNTFALSCDIDTRNIAHPMDSFVGNIPNTTANTPNTSMDVVYYTRSVYNDNRKNISFNDGDYYIDILIPFTWAYSFGNLPVQPSSGSYPYEFTNQASPPLVYLEDNTNNPSNNSWVQGVWADGFYKFRYYKKDYPNSNTINLVRLRIGVPTTYYAKSTDLFVNVNGYFSIDHGQCDSQKALQQEIQNTTNAVNDVNNSINDDTTDDPGSDITSMNDKLASNGSITQLLTLPIRLYQNILNATTGSCSRFELGELFGHSLILPCINLQNILGSSLWSIIDILISGIFILAFRKKMVDIFNNMTSLKDRGNELE